MHEYFPLFTVLKEVFCEANLFSRKESGEVDLEV